MKIAERYWNHDSFAHELSRVVALLAAALVLLAACSSDEEGGTSAGEPEVVAFSANVPAFITRAEVGSTSDLQTAGFGVFAYYTEGNDWATVEASAKPNFMYNQKVSGPNWTYDPVKYWPNDNNPADNNGATGSRTRSYVSFFAYAPHDGEGIDANTTGAPIIGYTWAADRDLLYANPQKDLYKYDPTDANDHGRVDDKVAFTFRHALAKVQFKVRRKEQTGSAITLNSLVITSNGATGGTFNLSSSTWTAMTGNNAALLNYTTPPITVTAYTDANAQFIGSALMMPGTVTFIYDIDYNVGLKQYTPEPAAMTTITIKMNAIYTVILVIDGDAIESYVLREREAEQW